MLLNSRIDAKEVSRWSFQDLSAGPGYAATLAVERESSRLVALGFGVRRGPRICAWFTHAQAGQPALHYEVPLYADFLFAFPRTRSLCRSDLDKLPWLLARIAGIPNH